MRVRVRATFVRYERKAGTSWLRRKYALRESTNPSVFVRSPSNTGGSWPMGFTSLGCCPTTPTGNGIPNGGPPPPPSGGPPPPPPPLNGGPPPPPPWLEAGELGRLGGGEPGEVGRAGRSMVELEGIAVVNVIIGEIVGEVRISAGMGSNRSCWSSVSE